MTGSTLGHRNSISCVGSHTPLGFRSFVWQKENKARNIKHVTGFWLILVNGQDFVRSARKSKTDGTEPASHVLAFQTRFTHGIGQSRGLGSPPLAGAEGPAERMKNISRTKKENSATLQMCRAEFSKGYSREDERRLVTFWNPEFRST